MRMRLLAGTTLALLSLTATSLFSQAPKSDTAKHGMTPEDLAKFLRVGSPVVSPDGKWIAYTVSTILVDDDKRVSHLWMVSWDGKEDIQLTHGKDSASSPRWSPDGRFLAFTSSRDGDEDEDGAAPSKADEGTQVWVLDRRGGDAYPLTNVKQDLEDYRWSPDSKRLLLTLREKDEPDDDAKGGKPKPPKPIVIDRFQFKEDGEGYLTDKLPHLYLFEIASKKLSKLTNAPVEGPTGYAEQDAEWSPDGKAIAFISNQTKPDPDRFANHDVFVVSAVAGSKPLQLTTFTGQDEGPPVWTPDSKRVIYLQGTSPHYSIYDMPQLAEVPATGGTPVLLAPKLDQWVTPPVLAPDGKGVLTTVAEDRDQYVAEVALDGGAVRRWTPEHGVAGGIDVAGGHIAISWTTDFQTPEIYALEEGKLHKLTTHNDALLATLMLAPAEELSAKTADGNEVHSLLTLPVGYVAGTKVPMLLRIHGGPTGQDDHEFTQERQLFAAHGYAVLNVNYRGSTGRGHAYSEAINADWGHLEVIDLLAAVQGAIATGKIDPDKLGVGGWSYGGILTDYLIASTNEFKAASSGAGMANLFGLYGVDEYILQYENELGPPWKNPDAYIKLSYPFFHADRIKTPTLFMGGDKDFNVPLAGGEQMYEALKSVGTPAELLVYPGQFHGFTRPSFIKDRYERWFGWYDKYVRGIKPQPAKPVTKK